MCSVSNEEFPLKFIETRFRTIETMKNILHIINDAKMTKAFLVVRSSSRHLPRNIFCRFLFDSFPITQISPTTFT